jgi:DnaJ family protein C protein 17
MSSSNNGNQQTPDKDPFDVLGVSFEATDADINKAYRKLALKLHPDKQQNNVTERHREKMAHEFQEIQQARAFLLDAEFESARKKYKTKLASQRLRRAADEARNKTMSINKKRMRVELQKQEEQASRASGDRRQQKSKADNVDSLRREGSKMREDFANKAAAEEVLKQAQRKDDKEERQVRLKWSRKKISISPSDDSLAKLLKRFGNVQKVEMLGVKGNAALVTFATASSVSPCVEFYKESDEMRASYVGVRKGREDEREAGGGHGFQPDSRATESVADWKLRREMEREELLRRMEAEEDNSTAQDGRHPFREKATKVSRPSNFPAQFPSKGYDDLEPFEKLERAEELLLSGLVSEDVLAQLKISQRTAAN